MPNSPPASGLAAVDITVRYGGVVANDGVSLAAEPGTVVGLIGPNGAGKTTFVDALTGFTRASGSVSVDGGRIDGMSVHRRRHMGLARTWQAGELFDSMSVLDNVLVSGIGPGWATIARDLTRRRGRAVAEAYEVLALLGIAEAAVQRPTELPLGMQRLVGVARAIFGQSKVLLLDEPAAGLDSHESREFGGKLRELAARGLAIVLVDHDMNLVFGVCDTVCVLDFGRVIATGSPREIRDNEAVLKAYLGGSAMVEQG
jgi:branched-chain amino acid transport system ATP-binding protein